MNSFWQSSSHKCCKKYTLGRIVILINWAPDALSCSESRAFCDCFGETGATRSHLANRGRDGFRLSAIATVGRVRCRSRATARDDDLAILLSFGVRTATEAARRR